MEVKTTVTEREVPIKTEVVKEVVKHVHVPVVQERIVEVPVEKIVYVEKVVEVPT